MNNIVVQKFGGTSLNNQKNRVKVAEHIKKCKDDGNVPVVIVSAAGRLGDHYSTDTLLSLLKETSSRNLPREQDLMLSCGEIISACLLVYTLADKNIKASVLTGAQAGIITDGKFNNSRAIYLDPQSILQLLKQNIVPVIAGYQGISVAGEVTTLGRGGSDTSAALIASVLQAGSIEIYSDVDGVMTADPRLVKDPEVIDKLDFEDLFELSIQGARIIHPRAAEIAKNAGIPIKVKSTFSGVHKTTIHTVKTDRPIVAIVNRDNIAYVKIISSDPVSYQRALKVFSYLSKENISVDFIDIRPEAITFVVDEFMIFQVSEILSEKNIDNQISLEYSMISVVGAGMTGLPGIMSKIVETLQREEVNILQTTDSHSSISILISKDQEHKAVNALHSVFDL